MSTWPGPAVLVVATDTEDRNLLAGVLRVEGYAAATAPTAAAARALMERRTFALVVCGARLPDQPGVSLASWVSEHHPATALVILGDSPGRATTESAGAYLIRPLGVEQFLIRVASALRGNPATHRTGNTEPPGQELEASEHRARELVRELLHAEQRERKRIAAELHDDTLQVITAALLQIDRLYPLLACGETDRAAELIGEIRSGLNLAMERARLMLFQLYPRELDQAGLSAIGELVERVAGDAGIAWRVEVDARRHPAVIEQLAYRTVREALVNVVKHAGASLVTVTVSDRDGSLDASIVDDGRGFDTSRLLTGGDPLHLGLHELTNRIEAAGGAVRIESGAGRGTSVQFTLPIEPA
jgi:signal transduction histidine kinase